MLLFHRLIEAFRAWRRGEKRIAPYGVRGRVYAKAGDPAVKAKTRPEAKMSARVYRATENAWYKANLRTGKLEKE